MAKSNRYDISGLVEAQFEPGSKGLVLKNNLGITSKLEMDRIEAQALEQVTDLAIQSLDMGYQFASSDICHIHKKWLGAIYPWAGQYRQVNLSKGDFPFASALHVEALMVDFGTNLLRRYTPCNFSSMNGIIKALAEVHVEFILIHPFREGNGRIGRILATMMGLQANLPLLNFKTFETNNKADYFSAIQAGLDKDYVPMENLFRQVIETGEKSR
jgi:cell filamentation protein